MSYRPQPESLAAQVIAFFGLNPDEELSVGDILAKFDFAGGDRQVHDELVIALDHDVLTWDADARVYRAGSAAGPTPTVESSVPISSVASDETPPRRQRLHRSALRAPPVARDLTVEQQFFVAQLPSVLRALRERIHGGAMPLVMIDIEAMRMSVQGVPA